jgi:hypothetical protein
VNGGSDNAVRAAIVVDPRRLALRVKRASSMRGYLRGETRRIIFKEGAAGLYKETSGCAQCAIDIVFTGAGVPRVWLQRPEADVCRRGRVAACIDSDAGNNRFRIVAAIHYNRLSLFVRHVLTHAEYDLWTRKNLNS